MRSAFSNCGRFAFARGNSYWARSFNHSLQASRKFVSGSQSFTMAPSTWRMLSASSPLALNKFSVMFAAAEEPVASGFAEQRGCSEAGMTCFAPRSSDDVAEGGDEVSEGLSAAPACSHVSLIKSLSDVIVFGTNWGNEMGKGFSRYHEY